MSSPSHRPVVSRFRCLSLFIAILVGIGSASYGVDSATAPVLTGADQGAPTISGTPLTSLPHIDPAGKVAPTTSATIPELVGELTPYRKVSLGFRISGRVWQMHLQAGELATPGSVIGSLEPQDLELAQEQSQAALAVLQAKLRMQETGSRPEEKQQAEEAVRQAKANLENAQSDFERTSQLFTTGAVSRQALDAAVARKDVAAAQHQSALNARALVFQGPRAEEKESTRAQIRAQEAALKLAKLQLSYCRLESPFPAVVAARLQDEGAWVTPSTPVYSLVQIDPLFAAAECPEQYVPLLKPGMRAQITVDALPGETYAGVLDRIPAVLDSKTRTARIEITLGNPDYRLKPGMFARIRLQDGETR